VRESGRRKGRQPSANEDGEVNGVLTLSTPDVRFPEVASRHSMNTIITLRPSPF
jgi:hypothetical protein